MNKLIIFFSANLMIFTAIIGSFQPVEASTDLARNGGGGGGRGGGGGGYGGGRGGVNGRGVGNAQINRTPALRNSSVLAVPTYSSSFYYPNDPYYFNTGGSYIDSDDEVESYAEFKRRNE